ncbi:hypothetical protein AB0F17_34665 [Nonomuraea sp. NPDC026600]|uniref:hypothetical protein n=1 Tax=Nonomuraea sp. NPDC026600 TaxID=3155363 RepID=UPI0033CFB37A
MSRTKHTRLARIRVLYTGETHSRALAGVQKQRYRDEIIPSAAPAQAELEACLLRALATSIGAWSPTAEGTLYGIYEVSPEEQNITVRVNDAGGLPPLARLLPALMPDGTLTGVPGLRSRRRERRHVIERLGLDGRVTIEPGRDWRQHLQRWEDSLPAGVEPLWQRSNLHPVEQVAMSTTEVPPVGVVSELQRWYPAQVRRCSPQAAPYSASMQASAAAMASSFSSKLPSFKAPTVSS